MIRQYKANKTMRDGEPNTVDNGSPPLRIASIVQQAGIRLEDKGGGAIHVRAIIKFLQQAGHLVTFMTFGPSILEVKYTNDLSAMREVRLGLTGNRVFQLFERAVRRIQRMLSIPYLAFFDNLRFYDACVHLLPGYDVIHERFSMLAIGGVMASRRLNLPLILEVNADFLEEMDSFGKGLHGIQRTAVNWTSAFCFRHATAIVAVSNQLKTQLVQKWQIPEKKITVLPNGADVDKFYIGSKCQDMRARLGLAEAPTAIFVGGFYPWHAPLELVEAFAKVSQLVPGAQLCLVGNGPMRQQAETRTRELGLEGVVFVGAVPHEQIPEWLAAANVALAPYAHLNGELWFSPLKLFEYMAAGKAIVASKVGQVAEVIQDGHNGILVEVGDVEGFAKAVACLLTDADKQNQLGQNARGQAVAQHSWHQYAERLEAIYLRARLGFE